MKKRIIGITACVLLAALTIFVAAASKEPFEPYFDEEKGMWCIDESTTYDLNGSSTTTRLYTCRNHITGECDNPQCEYDIDS